MSVSEDREATRAYRVGRLYLIYACGFVAFAFIMAVLSALGVPDRITGALLAIYVAVLFIFVAASTGTMKVREFFAAGRRIPPGLNGMAMAIGGASAGSFTAMVAALYLLGHAGFAFVIGACGAFIVGAVLIGPYLRRSGAYTLPDFLSARFGSVARVLGVLALLACTLPLLAAQLNGFSYVLALLLDIDLTTGLQVGFVMLTLCTVLGGMRSTTWTQVAQYIVLIIALAVVIIWVLLLHPLSFGVVDLAFGQPRTAQEDALSFTGIAYAAEGYGADFWLLALCLMVGGASLPHMATRAITLSDPQVSRDSMAWGLFFTALLGLAAPVVAGLARWAVDGGMTTPSPDLITVALPSISGMPFVFTAMACLGALAALLAAASALLVTAANSLGHDIYCRLISRNAAASSRLIVPRILMVGLAFGATHVAETQEFDFLTLSSWSLALAAGGLFPALVLGIWWRRANGTGAVLGMLAGTAITLLALIGNRFYAAELADVLALLPRLGDLSLAALGVPVGLVVTVLASLATRQPSGQHRAFQEALHRPTGGTLIEDAAA
ncbi:MAG: hypothetical protein AB7S80_11515 [Rhizobiaceae bacterium]